jgi:hypothetical protein
MKLFKMLFGLIRLFLLLAALLMGGIAFFRTGGFSGITWDLNDIKKEFSNLSTKFDTQVKSVKDIANVQTMVLKSKLAIIENKDFDYATKNLSDARELLSKLKEEAPDQFKDLYQKTIDKIDNLTKEVKSGVFVTSQKFEEILVNLDILNKS